MTPLELLARLSALCPPPRFPLLRYSGVLAPASKWRRAIVPRAPEPKACTKGPADTELEVAGESTAAPRAPPGPARHESPAPQKAASRSADTVAARHPPTELGDQLLTPNVLSVKHWDRLLGGALYAATPRVDWASLLRRSFQVDVLECPTCHGRLRVLGEVTAPAMVRLVLESLRVPTDAPPIARARDPTELLGAEQA